MTQCKSVLRGDSDGDRMVAMIILNKAGVKVSRSVMDSIRADEKDNETKLREANDVYDALQAFIHADRRGSDRDVRQAVVSVMERYNKFEGRAACSYVEGETKWRFGIISDGIMSEEIVYTKNKYTQAAAEALFKFFIDHSGTPALLTRICSAMCEFDR